MDCLYLNLLSFNDFLCYWGSWSTLTEADSNISAVLNSSGAVSVPPSVSSGRCLQLLVPSVFSGCSKPKWIYSAHLFHFKKKTWFQRGIMMVKQVRVSHSLLPPDTTILSSLHMHQSLLPHQLLIHQKDQITVQKEKKGGSGRGRVYVTQKNSQN